LRIVCWACAVIGWPRVIAATSTKRDGVRTLRRPALSLFLAVRRLSFSLVAGNFNVQMKAQRNLW